MTCHFKSLLLLAPVTSLSANEKRVYKKGVHELTPEYFNSVADNYIPQSGNAKESIFSPVNCNPEEFKKLPNVTIVVGKNDYLYPDIKAFRKKLVDHKTCQFIEIPGASHMIIWRRADLFTSLQRGDCDLLQPGAFSKKITFQLPEKPANPNKTTGDALISEFFKKQEQQWKRKIPDEALKAQGWETAAKHALNYELDKKGIGDPNKSLDGKIAEGISNLLGNSNEKPDKKIEEKVGKELNNLLGKIKF